MNPRRSPYSAVIRLAIFAAVLLLFLPGSATAQEEGPGWKVRSPFRPLDLATPNTIRKTRCDSVIVRVAFIVFSHSPLHQRPCYP